MANFLRRLNETGICGRPIFPANPRHLMRVQTRSQLLGNPDGLGPKYLDAEFENDPYGVAEGLLKLHIQTVKAMMEYYGLEGTERLIAAAQAYTTEPQPMNLREEIRKILLCLPSMTDYYKNFRKYQDQTVIKTERKR